MIRSWIMVERQQHPKIRKKLGYTFDNWYADENFSILFDFDISITSDTTIYAKWIANQYLVTFDAQAAHLSLNP